MAQQPYSVQARYFEERPPVSDGTEMDAGIAFGIRDDKDFDLLEQSALHDILRLDHYIHGKRRDLREKLFRTHGNEWHTLKMSVSGSSVTASVDDQTIYHGRQRARHPGQHRSVGQGERSHVLQ